MELSNSTRIYQATGFDKGFCFKEKFTVEQLLSSKYKDSDTELLYTLQEIRDEILDLRLNEVIYIRANRDDDNAKGVLCRIR